MVDLLTLIEKASFIANGCSRIATLRPFGKYGLAFCCPLVSSHSHSASDDFSVLALLGPIPKGRALMQIIPFSSFGSISVFASARSGSRAGVGACVVLGDGVQGGTRMGGEYDLNNDDPLSE